MTLIPEKKIFQKGEPVLVQIVISNGTKNKLIFNRRFLPGTDESFGRELTLYLTGPKEQPIPNLVLFQPSPLTKSDLVILLPGQSITQTLPLSNIFFLKDPGDYQLEAIYDTTAIKSALPFWRGRLVSPSAAFSIHETP